MKVEVVGGGDCGRVEGGSTSSLSQRKRAQRQQPFACSHQAGWQPAFNGNPSCPKLSLGWLGQVTLARLRQRATSDQNKDRRRDCADSPLGPGQGLGQGLWRTRSISRRWSRLKATQSGDPV